MLNYLYRILQNLQEINPQLLQALSDYLICEQGELHIRYGNIHIRIWCENNKIQYTITTQ